MQERCMKRAETGEGADENNNPDVIKKRVQNFYD